MSRETLMEKLKTAPPEVVEEYASKREQLVARVNRVLLQRPDICDLVGEKNIEMMKDNHSNHARFIESILAHYDPEVLLETVLWVFRVYRSRGFHPVYWSAQLNAWVDILKEDLSPESFEAIYPFYEWMIVHIPHFTTVSDAMIGDPVSSDRCDFV